MARSQGPTVSLQEFARRKRYESCPVCKLPPDIRAEIAGADGVPWRVRVAWLQQTHGVNISPQEALSHVNGRHDAHT